MNFSREHLDRHRTVVSIIFSSSLIQLSEVYFIKCLDFVEKRPNKWNYLEYYFMSSEIKDWFQAMFHFWKQGYIYFKEWYLKICKKKWKLSFYLIFLAQKIICLIYFNDKNSLNRLAISAHILNIMENKNNSSRG